MSHVYFTFSVSALKLVGCKITSCESILRFKSTRFVFNACIKRLYEKPAGRDPALIRRIQRRRYWRFFFRRSLYDDESAFKLRWFAVRNNVECDPRNPRLRSKILFRRFRATVPRFTRVISFLVGIFVFTERRYTGSNIQCTEINRVLNEYVDL